MKKILIFIVFLAVIGMLWVNMLYKDQKLNNSSISKKTDGLQIASIQSKKTNIISTPISNKDNIVGEKNRVYDSFNKSKKILLKIFSTQNKTIYCDCQYNPDKTINFKSCNFKSSGKFKNRTNRIEWEHVVPAQSFGQSFKEWRIGDSKCKSSKGKSYKGRKCANKVNEEYKYMQGDLYNLFPAIGEVNALRSNYTIAEIPGEKRIFGGCNMEISERKMEPRDEIKGDIARIYLYMDLTYPGRGIISQKNKKLIRVWNDLDPISKEECNTYIKKKKYQKNINIILEQKCILKQRGIKANY